MKVAAAFVVGVFVALTLAAAFAIAAGAPAAPRGSRADVLVIERAYTGPIERTGTLDAWTYTGAAMLVDFVPDGDPLFRNGFDGAEFSSCRP